MSAVATRKKASPRKATKLPKMSELHNQVTDAQWALSKARDKALEDGLRRLQATLTPAVLENEIPAVQAIYADIMGIERGKFLILTGFQDAIQGCHSRLVQIVAHRLFFRGDVEGSRARVLRDLVVIMDLGGVERRRGWKLDKDGLPIWPE